MAAAVGASFRHYEVCHDTVNEFVVCVYAARDEILLKTGRYYCYFVSRGIVSKSPGLLGVRERTAEPETAGETREVAREESEFVLKSDFGVTLAGGERGPGGEGGGGESGRGVLGVLLTGRSTYFRFLSCHIEVIPRHMTICSFSTAAPAPDGGPEGGGEGSKTVFVRGKMR